MGAKYSSGFVPFELQRYLELTVAKVEVSYAKFSREGETFVTRDAFSRALCLAPEVGCRHFAYFDPGRRGRVAAIDIWGAIALCCADREESKITFIFGLMDFDGDGRLNRAELTLLIHGVCRGVARIKQIAAPPLEVVTAVVEAAFSQRLVADKNESGDDDIDRGFIDLTAFLFFLKADERCRRFLTSLERTSLADVEDLYKQQGKLLLELANIDARLDEIEEERERSAADSRAYEQERGGDAKRALLCTMRQLYDEPSSDEEEEESIGDEQAKAAARARREADRAAKTALLSGGPREQGRARDRRGLEKTDANEMVAASPAIDGDDSKTTTTSNRHQVSISRENLRLVGDDTSDEDIVRAKLNAQLERRARRTRMQECGAVPGACATKVQYDDVFRQRARTKVRGFREDTSSRAVASADVVAISTFWKTLPQDHEGRAHLDLDTFEDLFEPLAVLVPDDEATKALREIPHTSSGEYTLADVLEWWYTRSHRANSQASKPHLALLEYVDALRRCVADVRQMATAARDAIAARVSVCRQWQPRQSSPEASAPAAGTVALAIGTRIPSAQTKIKVTATQTPDARRVHDFEDVPAREQLAEDLLASTRRDATASALLALDDVRRVRDAAAQESDDMSTVLWVDFVARETATPSELEKLAREIEAAASVVPRDYAVFDRVRCDVVNVKKKGNKENKEPVIVRVQLLFKSDPLEEVEAALPENARPSMLLGKASVVVELGKSMAELMRLSAESYDMPARMYGPQLDEFNPDEAEPTSFRAWRRATRKSVLASMHDVATLAPKALRDALESLGFSSMGALAPGNKAGDQGGGEARLRLRTILARKAARVGYGELSEFGKRVARRVFHRFDRDEDGSLDYLEFASLSRALGKPPPPDAAEYRKIVADSKLHAKQEAKTHVAQRVLGISERGVLAHYENRGYLGHDAAELGVGSLDDVLEAIISMSVDLDADVASQLEHAVLGMSRGIRGAARSPIARILSPTTPSAARETLLDLATFALRFVKGFFVDYGCRRASDLFAQPPAWLVTPAWFFSTFQGLRTSLADEDRGFIPTARSALADFFGDRWRMYQPEPDASESSKEIAHDLFKDPFGASATNKQQQHYLENMLMLFLPESEERPSTSGADPLTTEKREAVEAEAHAAKPGPAPKGIVARMAWLRHDLHTLDFELSTNVLPRRVRQNLEERRGFRIRELVAHERTLERCSYLALAHAVRSYDAARALLRGPQAIGVGNRTVTTLFETENALDTVDLSRLLPAGLGEASVLRAVAATKHEAARDLLRSAHEKIRAERQRIADEAAEAAEQAKNAALTREHEAITEEARLYRLGARAARRALVGIARLAGEADATADRQQLEAEEHWSTLVAHRKVRRSMSAAYAVSVGNLAVLFADRGRATTSTLQLQEALKHATLARQVMVEALRDRLLADAAASTALYAEYARACLTWDRATAAAVARRAQHDHNQATEEAELVLQLAEARDTRLDNDELEHERTVHSRTLQRLLEKVRGERHAAASMSLDPPPPAPQIEMCRHDDVALAYGIVLSNEAHILWEIGEPSDDADEAHRRRLYESCVATYASLGATARAQLNRLNETRVKLLAGHTVDNDDDGDEIKLDADELQIVQVGIELAGTFPPPSPEAIRHAKEAKLQAERRAQERGRLANKEAERELRGEELKLKRLRRHLGLMTKFDHDTFKLLKIVQPKRAARIRARELRQQAPRRRREKLPRLQNSR